MINHLRFHHICHENRRRFTIPRPGPTARRPASAWHLRPARGATSPAPVPWRRLGWLGDSGRRWSHVNKATKNMEKTMENGHFWWIYHDLPIDSMVDYPCKHRKNDGKWPLMVDWPIDSMVDDPCIIPKKKHISWKLYMANIWSEYMDNITYQSISHHTFNLWKIPSGNLLHSYWKWSFIVSFPIKNCDFP